MTRDNFYWAIITVESTFHEGDERSRTNPGHGYGAHTTTAKVFMPYTNYEEFVAQVHRKTLRKDKFEVIRCHPMDVNIETKITLR